MEGEVPVDVIAPVGAALLAAVVAYLALPKMSPAGQNVLALVGFAALMAMAAHIVLRNTVLWRYSTPGRGDYALVVLTEVVVQEVVVKLHRTFAPRAA